MNRGPFAGRPWLWRTGLAGGLLALAWAGLEAVADSDWLANGIRTALVRELAAATGGSVTIEAVEFGEHKLAFRVIGLAVRSSGDTSLPPLLEVPEASVRLGWRSILAGPTVVEHLHLREPHFRLTIAEDGTSNVPRPQLPEDFQRFVVHRFELTGGKLVWNGWPFQAEFSGSELEVAVDYDKTSGNYLVDAKFKDPRWGTDTRISPTVGSATAKAVIGSRGIEVAQASLRGDGFEIATQGALRNPRFPRIEGSYSATAQIATVAQWLGGGGSAATGSLQLEGNLEWQPRAGTAHYAGTVAATGVSVEWMDEQADAAANFAGDLNDLEVTAITGNVMGGQVTGSVTVVGPWDAPVLNATGTAAGIDFNKASRAIGFKEFPWNGLGDALLEISGSKSSGFESAVEFIVRPDGARSGLPLEGQGSLQYQSQTGTLTVSDIQLSTPETRLGLSGIFDRAGRGHLEVDASIGSKQAAWRLLTAVEPDAALQPAVPDGRYGLRGEVRCQLGQLKDTAFAGRIDIEDFVFRGERWERLTVRGEVSATAMQLRDGRLVDGSGELILQGAIPLGIAEGLDINVRATGMDAGKLARASGFGLPLEGRLSMNLEVAGSLEAPRARGGMTVTQPRFFRESFDRLTAKVGYGPGGFELQDALLTRGDSILRASASMSPADQTVAIDLESNRWPLEEFDWVETIAPGLSGAVQFRVNGTGRLGASELLRTLRLDGRWEAAELRRYGQDLGHWKGELRSGTEFESVELDWTADIFGGSVLGRAALWQVEPASYAGNVDYHDLSSGRMLALLGLPTEAVEGVITGKAGFEGVVGVTDTFKVSGTITSAEMRLSQDSLRSTVISNVFPLRWQVQQGTLRLDSMHLTALGKDFEIDGLLELRGTKQLNVGLDGRFNMALLGDLMEGIEADGTARVGLQLRGTLDKPTLEGSVELLNSMLGSPGAPVRLNDLNGRITFQDNQGKIEELTAASGGGTVRVGGAMAIRNSELEYRLHASAEDMRVNYPASINSVIDGEFTLAGAGSRSILDGNVVITRVSTAENLSFADLFGSLQQAEGDRGTSPVLQGMQVNLRVGAVSQLPVETSLVKDVEADINLEVLGTVSAPSILGTIGIAQGELRMLGTHYRINRGDIRFLNPLEAEPVLNVELETRIRDIDIALVLSGPSGSLDLSYRSDPPLPFHDLVNLVAVGKEPTADPSIASRRRIEQQSLVQTGADNLLSQAIARPVSRRLQRFFGVSRLKVDPQIGGLEANPSARISTEQQIADDITLIYSYDLSSAQQQAIRIEWNPDRKWSFIVTRDQNGLVGSDVLYKVRLR